MPNHLYIHATDVAALIGENRYKPKEDVFLDMWQDYNPVSFDNTRRKVTKSGDLDREAVQGNVNQRNNSIKRKADAIVATSASRKEAKTDITTIIKSDLILGLMSSALQDAAIECILSNTGTIPTLEDYIRHDGATTDTVESAQMESAQSTSTHGTSSYIRSQVRTFAGCRKEHTSSDGFGRPVGTTVHGRTYKSYSSILSSDGVIPVMMGGRVDGIKENSIIERMQRRSRLLGHVEERERIQLYVYMYITGLKTAQLIETFGDIQQVHTVRFEPERWNVYSVRIAKAVQEFFNMLFEDDDTRRNDLFSVG
jgi:hypothetical protein